MSEESCSTKNGSKKRPELLIIGLDGLDSKWVGRFQDKLYPIKSHKSDDLDEPVTWQAWPCMYAGKTAEQLNLTGLEKVSMRRIHKEMPERSSNVFDDISFHKKMGSFRMPMTYPVYPVNGWMVSGFPQPEGSTSDQSIGINLPNRYDEYRYLTGPYQVDNFDIDSRVQTEYTLVDIFTDIVSDEDVLFFGSQFPDHMGHVHHKRRMDPAYSVPGEVSKSKYIQRGVEVGCNIIDRLLNSIDPEHFIAVSDHGYYRHGHSDRSTLITDLEANHVESILDIRSLVNDVLKIEQSDSKYSERKQASEDVKDNLKAWGYR